MGFNDMETERFYRAADCRPYLGAVRNTGGRLPPLQLDKLDGKGLLITYYLLLITYYLIERALGAGEEGGDAAAEGFGFGGVGGAFVVDPVYGCLLGCL